MVIILGKMRDYEFYELLSNMRQIRYYTITYCYTNNPESNINFLVNKQRRVNDITGRDGRYNMVGIVK